MVRAKEPSKHTKSLSQSFFLSLNLTQPPAGPALPALPDFTTKLLSLAPSVGHTDFWFVKFVTAMFLCLFVVSNHHKVQICFIFGINESRAFNRAYLFMYLGKDTRAGDWGCLLQFDDWGVIYTLKCYTCTYCPFYMLIKFQSIIKWTLYLCPT